MIIPCLSSLDLGQKVGKQCKNVEIPAISLVFPLWKLGFYGKEGPGRHRSSWGGDAPHGSLSFWGRGSTFQAFQILSHPKSSLGAWGVCGSPAQISFESGVFLSRILGNGCGQLPDPMATSGKMCWEFSFLLEISGCGPSGGEIHLWTLQILHYCASDPGKILV